MAVQQNDLLIPLAQAGDREALDQLFLQIQQPIFCYLKTITKDSYLAEDLLQEVFIVIFRKIWLLNDSKAFFSWVYRTANRLAVRRLQKEKRNKILFQSELLEQQKEKEDHCIAFLQEIDVENAILNTSPASRAALFLRFIENKSIREIAAILEIPEGTVKSRLFNGLEQLRKQVK